MTPEHLARSRTLAQLQARTANGLDALAGQVASRAVSPAEFVVRAQALLDVAHARAAVFGAYRARRSPLALDSAIAAAGRAAASQQAFLLGFARDLAELRYRPKAEGGEGATRRKARFALYALRLGGTANQAWLNTVQAQKGVGVEVRWVRHASESCGDCRSEAERGWRPAYTLSRMPGDGSTRCLVRCRCVVTTRDGAQSYLVQGV